MDTFKKAYIPYKGYYSSPFARWQGSLQYDNAVSLGANTARRWFLEKKKIDPTVIDYLFFGSTVAQNHWFVAHNWAAAMLTDDKKYVPALFVNQCCSTSTTMLNLAAMNLEMGVYDVAFALATDRCSNGPHTIWPDPLGPGGQPDREDWNMDNFGGSPRHRAAMVETAENVAKEIGITKEECDAVVLRRYEQYQRALAYHRRGPGQVETGATRRGLELRRPDLSCRWKLRHHRDDKRQSRRTERGPQDRNTDRLLRFCAGETHVYACRTHPGR
jgi:acetyl-CoA acetyltransferase